MELRTGTDLKIQKDALYVVVADKLEDIILNDASMGVNHKLPNEQTLGETFGVSRPVVREALKLLNARGLITSRNGEGSFVCQPDYSMITDTVNRIVQLSVRYGAPGLIYDKIGDDYVEVNTYVAENYSVEDMKNYYSAEKYPWIYEDLDNATNIVNSQVFQNPPLLRSVLSQVEPKNVTTNRRLFVMYHYNNNEWMQKENMSTAIITPDQQDALDLECDGLVSYIDSFIANSILDGLTDESWESFQNGLDDYGYDYYIEWHQNYKDGTLNDFI